MIDISVHDCHKAHVFSATRGDDEARSSQQRHHEIKRLS